MNDLHDALLAIIVELKETKRELKEIKSYINPNAPHYITKEDGTKCLANSDKDCFEMPIIQEGRNVPALANFMKEPTLDNAKTWLGVQAQLFNRANSMGVALKFAALEGGADAYPVSGKDLMYSANANNSKMERDAVEKAVEKHKENIGTIIFLGKTPSLEEAWGKESLARLVYPRESIYNLMLVFSSNESKAAYDKYYASLKDTALKHVYSKAKKVVNGQLLNSYGIDVTPSVVAVYKDKKNNKSFKNTIAKGFPTNDEIIYGYKQFLIFNKVLEEKDFHGDNIWRAANEK
jgi:hypothetical protein